MIHQALPMGSNPNIISTVLGFWASLDSVAICQLPKQKRVSEAESRIQGLISLMQIYRVNFSLKNFEKIFLVI